VIVSSQRIPVSTFVHAPPVKRLGRCPRCGSRTFRDSLYTEWCAGFCGYSRPTGEVQPDGDMKPDYGRSKPIGTHPGGSVQKIGKPRQRSYN
jgi:ribosomal protein L37E